MLLTGDGIDLMVDRTGDRGVRGWVVGGMATAGDGVTARTASARVLIRGGTDEQTGEALTAAVAAERVRWCAALVRGLAARLVEGHWSAADVAGMASGVDAAGRPL